jgi:hypothetical protein
MGSLPSRRPAFLATACALQALQGCMVLGVAAAAGLAGPITISIAAISEGDASLPGALLAVAGLCLGVLLLIVLGAGQLLVSWKAWSGSRAWQWGLLGAAVFELLLLPWGFLIAVPALVGVAQAMERRSSAG